MKKTFYIFCFSAILNLSFIIPAYSQEIDSLKTLLNHTNQDTTKLNILHKLLELCAIEDNLLYAEPAVKIAEQNLENLPATDPNYFFYSKHLEDALNGVGYFYHQKGDTVKAIDNYQNSIKIGKRIMDNRGLSITLVNLANLYESIGDFYEAEPLYFQGLEMKKKVFGENNSYYAKELNKLAEIFSDNGNYNIAESLYVQSIKINKIAFGENSHEYATTLSNLATIYQYRGEYSKAEPLFIQAMEIKKETFGESHPDYASSIFDLALLYYSIGNYTKAEILFLQALKIQKKVLGETHIDYATSLNGLATLYATIGDYAKAELLYSETLEIRKKALGVNHSFYATSLSNLASVYQALGEYSKAEPMYLQAREIYKKKLGEANPKYALAINNLAVLYVTMGNYAKAEPLYLQEMEINEKALGKNHPDYATALSNIATLYLRMGNYLMAEPLLIQASEIYKSSLGETHYSYANSLNNQAILYQKIGNYIKALPLFIQAMNINKNALGENNPVYALSLNELASLYFIMGYYDKAVPLQLQAIEIIKSTFGENHPSFAACIINIASSYQMMDDYAKAEPLLLQAKEINKKTFGEYHPLYAESLGSLAKLYESMGNYAKAEPLYFQAVEINKIAFGETHPAYATSLNNLAELYDDIGDYAKAEALFKQALGIRKKALGENHFYYAASLSNLAGLYVTIGEYSKAESLYLQAMPILKKTIGEEHSNYANFLGNLARLYGYVGNYSAAKPLFVQAIEIKRKSLGENNSHYAQSIRNLAGLYADMGSYEKAEPLYLNSLEISFQNIKRQFSFLSEKEKELYFKTLSGRFEDLNIMGLKREESNPSITVEVYNNQLKTKGILLKSGNGMRNAVLSSNDEKLIATYDKWNSLKKEIANINNLPIEKRTADLPKLENEANDLEKELTKSSSVLSDFNSSLNINWKDIQTQLKPNEAAIEFTNFRYNKDSMLYCALLIKKDSEFPEMVQLFEEAQLANLLANLKENNNYAITSVYGSKRFTETKLYDIIWKPLESYLKGIEVINYSPSGLLHKVSFAALSNADDHYLMDNYKLNMLTSTAMVTKPTQSVFDKNTEVSLFGGINYSINDTNKTPWKYLAGTLSETEQLNNTFLKQGIKVNYIKAKDATKQEFKSVAANSNIIHIATHGFFFPEPKIIKTETDVKKENIDIVSRSASRAVELNYIRNDNPLMRSGLVFAGVNDYWNGITDDVDNNGILTALEVVNIDLRKNKLVVLSACETGLGDIRDGEGVYGLQRAFKMAGTENIIMSLWKVPDNETSEFMQTFYGLLFTEQNINQAFTETQNLMRKKYDPFYWAAFVLVR